MDAALLFASFSIPLSLQHTPFAAKRLAFIKYVFAENSHPMPHYNRLRESLLKCTIRTLGKL